MSLEISNKFISKINERNTMISQLNPKERIELIKSKYGLTHGKGKRKKKK